MRMPWTKSDERAAKDTPYVSKADASRAGSDGDGKEHDLQYWLDSGFLTLPKAPPEDA
jgi:hypothetical protein